MVTLPLPSFSPALSLLILVSPARVATGKEARAVASTPWDIDDESPEDTWLRMRCDLLLLSPVLRLLVLLRRDVKCM